MRRILGLTLVIALSNLVLVTFLVRLTQVPPLVVQTNYPDLGSPDLVADLQVTDQAESDQYISVGNVLGAATDPAVTHRYTGVELPLQAGDYYGGKYINAKAGANELNAMPDLVPGQRIRIMRDNYLTIRGSKGYVQSDLPAFGSGVCWTVTVLGVLMDQVNATFRTKYGIDLFVFAAGDRVGHGHTYPTYRGINRGYGYSVYKNKFDYSFTVNPAVSGLPGLSDLKLKIILTATPDYKGAVQGQSIGGYLLSNKEHLLYDYQDQALGPLWQKVVAKYR